MSIAEVDLPAIGETDCTPCTERFCRQLSEHDGVERVEAGPNGQLIHVTFDPELCSPDCVRTAANDMRTAMGRDFGHESHIVEGMDCGSCARTIETAVRRIDGVTDASVSFTGKLLRVEYRADSTAAEKLSDVVTKLGYAIGGRDAEQRSRRLLTPLRITLAAIWLLVAALIVDFATPTSADALYAAATLVGGTPLARSGLRALWATRRPNINLLMAIAAVGAMAIGAWLEAALVVTLFSVGELLEGQAIERARNELSSLVALSPATAWIQRRDPETGNAVEVEAPVSALAVGDAVIIRPGGSVPVDGIVRDGESAVNQAAITGEATPVDKTIGDSVFAGTLNQQGRLIVEVTSAPGNTTLARIKALVEQAQAEKSPSERWVDSFARWYTPAIVVAAALVMVVPTFFGVSFDSSFYAALALLIIACPCALVISTPVSIVSALGRCSAAGVLVKGGAYLEQAATIDTVAFDKTGTLTEGRPRVSAIRALRGTDDEVLNLAASVEQASEHPLAQAIVGEATARGLALIEVKGFHALTGLGARGQIGPDVVAVGDTRLVGQMEPEIADQIEELRRAGQTAVVVAVNSEPVGLIGLADTVRDASVTAVSDLERLGMSRVVLLTGDNPTTAAPIASEVGISDVRASLMPEDKAREISALRGSVAMVGDGVNDAPALAAANLGIAMGTAGSDTAIEVADVAVMGDDPRKVAGLIGLARWTKSVVRQNIVFSLGTKLVAVAILAAGELPLWGAVVADVAASLVVVANGLRLVRGRPHGRRGRLPILPPANQGA